MISVLMFVPQYPYPIVGGLEKQAHELSKALVELGVNVKVISGKVLPAQASEEVVEGIRVIRVGWPNNKILRFATTPFTIFYNLFKLRNSFNVIHLHQHSWVGLYVILMAKLLRKPIITKLPNVGEYGLPGMKNQLFGRLRLAVIRASDAIVAMSKESLAELIEVGYSKKQVLLTPNGIKLDKYQKDVTETILDNCTCRVVFLGRLTEQKQLNDLLDAWKIVCLNGNHQALLEIWGSGPKEIDLKQYCNVLKIESRVLFTGHIEDAAERLKEKEIFVLPSSAEGNSNSILEAMAAGLPIVSTPVGGTPMLVGEEGVDLLFPVGDHLALSQILLLLIKDRYLCRSIGKSMRVRVEQFFDIAKVAQTYIKAYKLLADHKSEKIHEVSNLMVVKDYDNLYFEK